MVAASEWTWGMSAHWCSYRTWADQEGNQLFLYVTVPGRNRTLFRWSHYCIQTTVTQYFHHGWGSYVLCKLMNTWYIIYTVHMSPTLNGSSGYSALNAVIWSNYVWFLLCLPDHYVWLNLPSFCFCFCKWSKPRAEKGLGMRLDNFAAFEHKYTCISWHTCSSTIFTPSHRLWKVQGYFLWRLCMEM